jgi:hypothetical protein
MLPLPEKIYDPLKIGYAVFSFHVREDSIASALNRQVKESVNSGVVKNFSDRLYNQVIKHKS